MCQNQIKTKSIKNNKSVKIFKGLSFSTAFSYCVIILVLLSIILPFAHELAKSFSYPTEVETGQVKFIPKSFTLGNYEYFIRKHLESLTRSLLNTLFLVFVGGGLSIIITSFLAFPLSRPRSEFIIGPFLIYAIVGFIIIQKPIIPLRMTMQYLGLLDSLWAIVFNLVMMPFLIIMTITFFKGIPEEIIESCRLDGANDFQVIWHIIIPLSKAIIVTIFLLQAVAYWNAFLQAKLFIMNVDLYPIQNFAFGIMRGGGDELQGSMNTVDPFAETESIKSALTIMMTIPLCVIYISLQKHFTSGMVSGAVKE